MSSSNVSVSGGFVPSSSRSARALSSASGLLLQGAGLRTGIQETTSNPWLRRRPPGWWRHNAMLPRRESSQLSLQSPGLSELVSKEFSNLDVSEDLTPPSFENARHVRGPCGGLSRLFSRPLECCQIFLALERLERDEHLKLEQLCMMLEPTLWFGGMGLQDRHNDWRLDVDGMSYEELLALEERMGDVCTGLTEEDIKHPLKASKYFSAECILHGNDAKCSICQDEYTDGDELGSVGCGHFFHSGCIKQWLTRKNLCPICKATACAIRF